MHSHQKGGKSFGSDPKDELHRQEEERKSRSMGWLAMPQGEGCLEGILWPTEDIVSVVLM